MHIFRVMPRSWPRVLFLNLSLSVLVLFPPLLKRRSRLPVVLSNSLLKFLLCIIIKTQLLKQILCILEGRRPHKNMFSFRIESKQFIFQLKVYMLSNSTKKLGRGYRGKKILSFNWPYQNTVASLLLICRNRC